MTWVSMSFAPGPQRVESGDRDPDFVARPVGFTAAVTPFESRGGSSIVRAAEDLGLQARVMPLLWDGDQA